MKRLWIFAIFGCLLCGCAEQEVLETVADELAVPAMAQMREISVTLPDNAVAPVLENESLRMYSGNGYEILIETMEAGNLDATIRALCGYDRQTLTVLQTWQQEGARYDFVWACAVEKGDLLGRGLILDDGHYHYCMTVLRDADGEKSQIVWDQVFASFTLL